MNLAGFAVVAMLAAASEPSPVADVVAELAADLSGGDAPAFLAHFDRTMAGYARLSGLIQALAAQGDVGSSVEIAEDTGDDRRRRLALDWILELAGERRRQTVRCTFERQGKRWKVTAIEPVEFFALSH
jgi:hypothetical protein